MLSATRYNGFITEQSTQYLTSTLSTTLFKISSAFSNLRANKFGHKRHSLLTLRILSLVNWIPARFMRNSRERFQPPLWGTPGLKHHVRVGSWYYVPFTSSSQIQTLEARPYFTRVVLSRGLRRARLSDT